MANLGLNPSIMYGPPKPHHLITEAEGSPEHHWVWPPNKTNKINKVKRWDKGRTLERWELAFDLLASFQLFITPRSYLYSPLAHSLSLICEHMECSLPWNWGTKVPLWGVNISITDGVGLALDHMFQLPTSLNPDWSHFSWFNKEIEGQSS